MQLNKSIANEIESIFTQNIEVDWTKRVSVKSRIRILICKELMKNHFSKEEAEELSNNIVKMVIEKHTEG